MNYIGKLIFFLSVIHVLSVKAQTTYTYTLINADTDEPVVSGFNSNISWDISNGNGLNLITDVESGFYRIKFSMSNGDSRVEGSSPYAAYGDMNGNYGNVAGTSDYFGWQPIEGNLSFVVEYYLTAADYSNNQPNTIDDFTIQFTDGPTNSETENGSIWTEFITTAFYMGKVAVGRETVPDGYALAIDGHIRAREVRIDQDNWPDYVFQGDYKLRTLEQLREYLNKNGHLPNIPSAKEVEEQGIELGEMNKLLLEKIEELTLYVLQQQEQLKMQQKEISSLKQKLQ